MQKENGRFLWQETPTPGTLYGVSANFVTTPVHASNGLIDDPQAITIVEDTPQNSSTHLDQHPKNKIDENQQVLHHHEGHVQSSESHNSPLEVAGTSDQSGPAIEPSVDVSPAAESADNSEGYGKPSSATENRVAKSRPVSGTKRAAQNRSAQKAYRERKDKYIKDLEATAVKVVDLEKTVEQLRQENAELRRYTVGLQKRIMALDPSARNK